MSFFFRYSVFFWPSWQSRFITMTTRFCCVPVPFVRSRHPSPEPSIKSKLIPSLLSSVSIFRRLRSSCVYPPLYLTGKTSSSLPRYHSLIPIRPPRSGLNSTNRWNFITMTIAEARSDQFYDKHRDDHYGDHHKKKRGFLQDLFYWWLRNRWLWILNVAK